MTQNIGHCHFKPHMCMEYLSFELLPLKRFVIDYQSLFTIQRIF